MLFTVMTGLLLTSFSPGRPNELTVEECLRVADDLLLLG
jgi:hypothetical protein